MFLRVFYLFRSEQLSTNIKLILHKALIKFILTYACSAWEFAADTCMKLQRLQYKGFRTISNFQSLHWPTNCMWLSKFRTYDFMTRLGRPQTDVTRNHGNAHILSIGRDEAAHRKYKRLKLGGGLAYNRSGI
jgi:hypothetical protein